ncbi:restriction endonuclease subunit S [Streptomyces sp. NPDC014735]|uniref:restriction endonuclease subunit S n=1 Tax=unclassified Streptomyces TaxID=2593676 RepID=UPI003700F1B4
MAEWPIVRFEELAANEKSSISKPYGSAYTKDDYVSDGVPLVRGGNLGNGIYHDDDYVFITEEKADQLPGANLAPGDLVITHRGTIGQASMIPRSPRYPRYVLSTSQVKARLDSSRAVPEFYYYWLLSPAGQHEILSHVSTVGVPGLVQPVASVKGFKVPHPPLREQEAVAEVLGALDDKIAANERITATASELAAAHYLATPELEIVKITDVAQVTMGQSPPGETFNEQGMGLPFYQGTRDFGFRFPGYRVWCTAVTRQAEANDVLVSVRAPVGQINVAAELCGIGRGVASVRAEKHPHVLLQALSADGSIWLPYEAEGTVFGSINKKQFTQLEIGWPTLEFIDSLESRLSALDQRIRRATEESRTLATLRDTLLPQLMSGKLRVRDAEKIVEDAV